MKKVIKVHRDLSRSTLEAELFQWLEEKGIYVEDYPAQSVHLIIEVVKS